MDKLHQKAGLIESGPARIIKPGRRGTRGHVVLFGNKVEHESNLERDFLLQMFLDPTLIAITSQPVTINYRGRRGKTHYTPDYLTVHRGSPETRCLVEIKYRDDLFSHWSTLKPGLKEGRRYARENNMSFIILTENEIRTPPLEAAAFLKPFTRLPLNELIEEHLIHRLAIIGVADPMKLLVAAYASEINREEAVDYIWKLIGTHKIQADLKQPISMNTPIWIDLKTNWRTSDPYSWRPIAKRIAAAQARFGSDISGWSEEDK